MDCFRVIAWLTLAAVPLLLFVRRFKPGGRARVVPFRVVREKSAVTRYHVAQKPL